MSNLIYLSNGQQAELINELPEGKFLVDPIYSYQDEHTNEWFDLPSNGYQIVDNVFKNAPIEKLTEEIKDLNSKIDVAQNELQEAFKERNKITGDIRTLKNQLTDMSKSRIELKQFRECKMFAFFVKDIITPVVIGEPNKIFHGRAFKIMWSVDMMNGKVRNWISSMEIDTGNNHNYTDTHVLDEEYPFMFDISDDELAQITKNRSDNMDFSKLHWWNKNGKVPEQYQTDRLKKYFEAQATESKKKWIDTTKAQIAKLQKELNEAIS
jgi:DNA-binding transcriptional regulator GbsR (MarR family)